MRTLCVMMFTVFLIVANPALGSAQDKDKKQDLAKVLGWDLTYSDLIKKNKVKEDAYLPKWLKESAKREFVEGVLAKWDGEKIVSSVLIEAPAFHAGEHSVYWLIRTKDNAYSWESYDSYRREGIQKKEIATKKFDTVFKDISSWQQLVPTPPKVKGQPEGFIGFLNINGEKQTRQMLLTLDDFFDLEKKEAKPGRLMKVFETFEK